MSLNVWNVFAPVYEFAMRSQKNIYDYMYERIGEVAKGKDVLELATGPGMIARHIAPLAKSVIANALHIIPNPEKALAEIRRVLKDDGVLIAPNFIFREGGKRNLWQKFLSLVGVRFAHEWSENEYRSFLIANGWPIEMCIVLKGRIDLAYVECGK
jgi:ubiquinone/menaquinone biosynthesis C-methylase UbiE